MEDYLTFMEQSCTFDDVRGITLRKQPTNVFKICFRFCCHPVICDWARFQDSSAQCLRQTHPPNIVARANVTLLELLRVKEARGIITEELKGWPMSEELRMALIDNSLFHAREAVRAAPTTHNVVYFNVHVTLYHHNVFDGERLIEEESLQGQYMVPASESSIERILERKEKLASLEENEFTECCCSICLEEFVGGGEVVSMPCRHVFHGECIEKWLRTSHYCPVCRFEMPTER